MVFKLVRIDKEEPAKIQLSIGTHVIGRNWFLHDDDNDERVSRNHAELIVTEDTITLKSIHQNPCFYIRKNILETLILLQNNSVSLYHGDKFGLVPDYGWYEILHCPGIDPKKSASTSENTSSGILNDQHLESEEEEDTEEQGHVPETNDGDEELTDENETGLPSLLTANEESTQGYEVHPLLYSKNDTNPPTDN